MTTGIVAPWFFFKLAGGPKAGGVISSLAAQIYSDANLPGVQLILVFAFAATGVYAWLQHRYPLHLERLFTLQLSLDLLLVSGLVYTFGGIRSPFSLFYALVIILAAFNLAQRIQATTFATAALALYTFVQMGHYYAWNWPPEEPEGAPTTLWLVYNLTVALVGFYGSAILGTELARRTRLAEEAFQEQKGQLADLRVVLQDVVQSIASGLITTDLDGVVTSVNRAGLEILERAEGELLDRPIFGWGLFDAEEWAQASGRCVQEWVPREETELERGGETLFIGYSLSPLKSADGAHLGYIVIFQDLSEYRKLQEELQLKDRMAAVGELAAGLAHEIGNPLAAISGSAQMLSTSLTEDSPKHSLLRIIVKESQRLDRTVKSFLQFSRPKEASLARFDIARLLREEFTLLSNSPEVSAHHRLVLDLEPRSAFLVGDQDQISQIFWNLARNGLRAMADGGTLTLEGRQRADGGYSIRVIDTGRGMPEEERARLFHPFHSFFDEGTGIGMAMVYRIVEEHGGRLSVESTPEEGTAITVELPPVARTGGWAVEENA